MALLLIYAQFPNCYLLVDIRWLSDEPRAFGFGRKLPSVIMITVNLG